MKTMLDKCAVAGDITQAIDRRGAWTCAIVIAGGTELTAVKLQSCDTADGSFSDFKTLIPASEAETDQYKGFVIDLDGAKKFIKVTGATMATCVLGDCDVDVKEVAIKAGEIPSGADLENNKTATINVSTYTEPVEIEPTAGKDGMKKATVTLSNIPSGADIEANKEATIDVSQYSAPVEITPTEGKDGMAKATVTLSNIPSAPTTMYCWQDNLDPPEDKAFCVIPNPKVGDKVFWIDADSVFTVGTITAVTETTLTTNRGTLTRTPSEDVVLVS